MRQISKTVHNMTHMLVVPITTRTPFDNCITIFNDEAKIKYNKTTTQDCSRHQRCHHQSPCLQTRIEGCELIFLFEAPKLLRTDKK